MDEGTDPSLSVLAEGHPCILSYEYPDFLNSDGDFVEFDSYLVPESDLKKGALKMLKVDDRVMLPEITHTVFIITDSDVNSLVHLTSDQPTIAALAARVEASTRIMNCPAHEFQRAYVSEDELRRGNIGLCDRRYLSAENGQIIQGRHNVSVAFWNCRHCFYTLCEPCKTDLRV